MKKRKREKKKKKKKTLSASFPKQSKTACLHGQKLA